MAARRQAARTEQALRHRSDTLSLSAAGSAAGNFRIVMISDTHGKAHPKSAQLVRQQAPDLILHAGDVGDVAVLKPFAAIAPLHVVRGNIDPRGAEWFDSIAFALERGGRGALKLLLMHIAVYGVKLRADARRLAQKHQCSLVVCGHSHVPFLGQDRGITLINPGSIGPRRFLLPIVFGVLDIAPNGLSARHISCETGEVWQP